jgi:hypothetical protein
MKIENFDWFLHTMLFYYTQHVIQKQSKKEQVHQIEEIDNDEGEEDEPNAKERHWSVEED